MNRSNLCLSQAFINFIRKDTEYLSLDLIVAEQEREEILILLQPLDQCIVNVIKVRKLEILDGIVPCACLQLVGLQQNIPNLQHSLDRHIVIIGFSRAAVDFRNNLGKLFFFCLAQTKTIGGRQLYHGLCDKVWSRMFLRLFLNEIGSLDFTVQIISAARMLDIDVSQQICDEVILLMQVGILKAGHLQQELIKSDEMAHHGHDFVLLNKLILLNQILCAFEIKSQLLLILGGDIPLVEQFVGFFDIIGVKNGVRIDLRLQIINRCRRYRCGK